MFDIEIGAFGTLYPEDFDALKKINLEWEMLHFSKLCVFNNTPVKVEVKKLTAWPTVPGQPEGRNTQEIVFVTPSKHKHLGVDWLLPAELHRRINV